MNLFQLIGIPVAGLLLIVTLAAMVRRRVAPRVGVLWSVIWIMAGCAIAWPKLTSSVARFLGIGRGTDLILYCAILAMMIGFFMMYMRYRKVEEEITKLVRHLAIEERSGSGSTEEDR